MGKGWSCSTAGWRIPESNYPLLHSILPLRLGYIGFLNGDILEESGNTECNVKFPAPTFRASLPNWPPYRLNHLQFNSDPLLSRMCFTLNELFVPLNCYSAAMLKIINIDYHYYIICSHSCLLL